MSQPFTFQAANNRSPLRIGQITFTVLALLAFALGQSSSVSSGSVSA